MQLVEGLTQAKVRGSIELPRADYADCRVQGFLSRNRHMILGVSGAVLLIVSHRMDRNAESKEAAVKRKVKLESEIAAEAAEAENFGRFMRFGMVDMSILLMSLVAGVSFDGAIARLVGVQGYGAIVGAGLGNVTADVIAGLPEGASAALGVGLGSLLPLLPIGVPMLLRLPLTRRISLLFGLSALGFCIGAFVWGYEHHEHKKVHAMDAATQTLLLDVEALIKSREYDTAIQLLQQQQQG